MVRVRLCIITSTRSASSSLSAWRCCSTWFMVTAIDFSSLVKAYIAPPQVQGVPGSVAVARAHSAFTDEAGMVGMPRCDFHPPPAGNRNFHPPPEGNRNFHPPPAGNRYFRTAWFDPRGSTLAGASPEVPDRSWPEVPGRSWSCGSSRGQLWRPARRSPPTSTPRPGRVRCFL